VNSPDTVWGILSTLSKEFMKSTQTIENTRYACLTSSDRTSISALLPFHIQKDTHSAAFAIQNGMASLDQNLDAQLVHGRAQCDSFNAPALVGISSFRIAHQGGKSPILT
jgi:hypothetical protein